MRTTSGSTPLLVGLCMGVLSIAFEVYAVTTAMPYVVDDLGYREWYAWAFSLYMLGMVFSTVAGGRVSDRIGPVVPLAVGTGIFAVGLGIAGLAPVMPLFLAGRLIQGLGAGLMNVSLYVVIAQVWEDHRRATVMTWISAMWVLPAFIGPPVAGWIARLFSWHWVFLGLLPLLVLTAVLIAPPLLRMSREGTVGRPQLTEDQRRVLPPQARPVPLWAGLALAVGSAAIQVAGQRLDPVALLIGAVGLVLLGVGLPPAMPPGFWKLGAGLAAIIAVRMAVPGTFFAAESFMPLMLLETRGVDVAVGGLMLAMGAVGWSTGAVLQARGGWLRRDRKIVLGAALSAVGLAWVAWIAWAPWWWFGWTGVAWAVGGLGMGLLSASTAVAVMNLSPNVAMGRNNSSLQVGENLGSGLSLAVAGTIFAALQADAMPEATFGWPFVVLTGICLLGVLLALRIGPVHDDPAPGGGSTPPPTRDSSPVRPGID